MYLDKKILKSDVYSLPSQAFSYNKILADESKNIVQKIITFDKDNSEYSIYLEWEEPCQELNQNENGGVI